MLLGTALLARGCDDKTTAATDPAPDAATEPTDTIKIVDFVFDPASATVKEAGQKVSIPNADAAPHTITGTGSGKAFDSGTIEGKATGVLDLRQGRRAPVLLRVSPLHEG